MKIRKMILPIICVLMMTIMAYSVTATTLPNYNKPMSVDTSIYGSFSWDGGGTFTITSQHGNGTTTHTFNVAGAVLPGRILSDDIVVVSYTNVLMEYTDVYGHLIFRWMPFDVVVTRIKGNTNNPRQLAIS